ncbi:MAG: hypothetical protein LBJ59_00545 [Zoogloeaceae bacterium]|jgi:hypothetical protein|nr:hypothetical protein [Zoogloeaceae bacterium]
MKLRLSVLSFCLLLAACATPVLQDGVWYSFEQEVAGEDEPLVGYRDESGQVMIEPKSHAVSPPERFKNIIAVTEYPSGESYFLTKNGKVATPAGFYMFDNSPDCENEGYIRFRGHDSDRAGLLNKRGEITIPAEYNDLTRAMNGMVAALRGATKEYYGEHHGYRGGHVALLDIQGQVLVENFVDDRNPDRIWASHYANDGKLNLYSLRITSEPHPDSDRMNFKGVDGRYYSFIDYEKEFRVWLKELIAGIDRDTLARATNEHVEVTLRGKGNGGQTRRILPSADFVKDYKAVIAAILWNEAYSISNGGGFNSDLPDMKVYRNYCGEHMDWRYPSMELHINPQEWLVFLRTEQGYRLVDVVLNTNRFTARRSSISGDRR